VIPPAGCTTNKQARKRARGPQSQPHRTGNRPGQTWAVARRGGRRRALTLRLGREDAAEAAAAVGDQVSRSAVEVCGFRTGTALSIALRAVPATAAAAAAFSAWLGLATAAAVLRGVGYSC
jgi:hypothetical protein